MGEGEEGGGHLQLEGVVDFLSLVKIHVTSVRKTDNVYAQICNYYKICVYNNYVQQTKDFLTM